MCIAYETHRKHRKDHTILFFCSSSPLESDHCHTIYLYVFYFFSASSSILNCFLGVSFFISISFHSVSLYVYCLFDFLSSSFFGLSAHLSITINAHYSSLLANSERAREENRSFDNENIMKLFNRTNKFQGVQSNCRRCRRSGLKSIEQLLPTFFFSLVFFFISCRFYFSFNSAKINKERHCKFICFFFSAVSSCTFMCRTICRANRLT